MKALSKFKLIEKGMFRNGTIRIVERAGKDLILMNNKLVLDNDILYDDKYWVISIMFAS